MNDSDNNLELQVNQIVSGLDLEQIISETQGADILMAKFAPQEIDRLSAILSVGLRSGLANIIQNPNQSGEGKLKILRSAIVKELSKASKDFGTKDFDKEFNVGDFSSRVYAGLP